MSYNPDFVDCRIGWISGILESSLKGARIVCKIFEPWKRKAKAREELARQIKAEKARINKEKAEESKKKNDLLEEYVKQFVPEETEEVIDSENQTVTIKAVVS